MIGAENKKGFMYRLAEFIVDRRNIIFAIVIVGIIFSVFSMGWVNVENDLTAFLPEDSGSKKGVEIMNEEFVTYGMAQVMIANVTLEEAEEIAELISAAEGVGMVEFDGSEAHYKNTLAYYSVTFLHPQADPLCVEALERVENELSAYDLYVYSEIGNPLGEILDQEVTMILGVAAVIILIMLLLTSKTFAEVPVILLTFMVAMILNMGTNFLFDRISFVSNSVTSILQLALSLDYAIILINRYKEERELHPQREAVVEALSKAVPEVFGSSLTTVGGISAMLFMRFLLGADMAICLIKAVMFAIMSVFFFMPGLLMLFGDLMKKTQHRSLIPNMSFIGKFAYKTRKVVPIIFAVIVVGAIFVSSACPFSYAYSDQKTAKENEQSMAKRLIDENFGASNMLALIVPSGDYEAEAELLSELTEYSEVKSAMGLANTEALDGYTLADKLTPRQFSELAGVDYELATVVYAAYAAEGENYGEIINNLSSYGVPLIDIFLFVSRQIDSGLVSLEGEQAEMLAEASVLMKSAKELLVGENYDRMLLYLNLPVEGEEAFAFLDEIRAVAAKYYPADEVYLAGNLTSSEDFMLSFEIDNVVVTAVSIIIVLIVLLFAFKSVAMPVILILVIQGAIWINFSVPALMKTPLFFLGYLIITAIQMGANIDYAIVIGTRYNEMKKKMPKREAIIDTMSFAFPTVITSGAIMSVAGFLIGYMSSVPIISSMGVNLGRGTVISIILVLFVLPQLLLITDKLVDKTAFTLSKPKGSKRVSGKKMRIKGIVSGEISGTVNGVIDAVIDGNVNLTLHSGEINQEKEEYSCEK